MYTLLRYGSTVELLYIHYNALYGVFVVCRPGRREPDDEHSPAS